VCSFYTCGQMLTTEWITLGDPVLLYVTHAILFGCNDSGAMTTPPPSGYTIDDVACAVMMVRAKILYGRYGLLSFHQIIHALLEWQTGSYYDLSGCWDGRVLVLMDKIKTQARALLLEFKERHAAAWTKFSILVHSNHIRNTGNEGAIQQAVELLESYNLTLHEIV
jgi:hypothetical protein